MFKYDINPGGESVVQMPIGSSLLHVSQQTDNDVKLWAIVEDTALLVPRHFFVVGTGHALPDDIYTKYRYVGTVHVWSGAIVLHVFEVMI